MALVARDRGLVDMSTAEGMELVNRTHADMAEWLGMPDYATASASERYRAFQRIRRGR